MALFENIQIPLLDPRSEDVLVEEARLKAFNASGGKLNDFSAGSPIAALIEAQAFCGSEVLYYANKLVPTLALQFYKNAGVVRKLGTPSTVELTFVLANSSTSPYTIPIGFQVSSNDGKILFKTDKSLTISPGIRVGKVTATSIEVGSKNNIAAYSITVLNQPLTNLEKVFNDRPSQGGSDKETLEQTIERGNLELRLRGLISVDDYERTAETVIGVGSRFKAIGNLGADKQSYVLGAVHLFGVDQSGNPITNSQILAVTSALTPHIHLASSLFVSPMDVKKVVLDVVVVTNDLTVPLVTAKNIWQSISSHLNPATYPIGQPILMSEVEYHIRKSAGVTRLQQVLIDGNHLNVNLANQYTVADIQQMNLKIINTKGIELLSDVYYRGKV